MSFVYFVQLPKELQLAIWRICLPRRVVELDEPYPAMIAMELDPELVGSTTCQLSHTSRLNRCPPVISHVCQDSRAIALEHSGFISPHDMGIYFGCCLDRVWLNRARDTVHLNWEPAYDAEFVKVGDPVSYWLSRAAGAADASINDGCFQDAIRSRTPAQLSGIKKTYQVCIKMVSIHADEGVAITSGLFGLLGEERIVLVDATNSDRRGQFAAFWKRHGSKEDHQTAHFFLESCSDNEWASGFAEEIRIGWLFHLWQQLGRPAEDIQGQSRIWARLPGENDRDDEDDWEDEPYMRQHWIPNLENSWVSSELEAMPDVRPVIMFRLCTQKCT